MIDIYLGRHKKERLTNRSAALTEVEGQPIQNFVPDLFMNDFRREEM